MSTIIGSDLSETLTTALSDFWAIFFKDYDFMNQLGRGLEGTYGQTYLDLMSQVLNISLEDAPLFSKKYWHSILFYYSDMIPIIMGDPKDSRWLFPLEENLASFSRIYNKLYKPEYSFELDTDNGFELVNTKSQKEFLKSFDARIDLDTNYVAFKHALFDDDGSPQPGFAFRTVTRLLLVRLYDEHINFSTNILPGNFIRFYNSNITQTFKIDVVGEHYVDIVSSTPLPDSILLYDLEYSIGSDSFAANNIIGQRKGGALEEVEKEIPVVSAWIPNALIDEFTLYNNFGCLIDEYRPSTEEYRAFLLGIFYFFMTGASIQNVESALNVIMGYPVLRNENETIETIVRNEINYTITTDKFTYKFPPNTPFKPEIVLAANNIDYVPRSHLLNLITLDSDSSIEDLLDPIVPGDFVRDQRELQTGETGHVYSSGGVGYLEDSSAYFTILGQSITKEYWRTVTPGDVIEIKTSSEGNIGWYTVDEVINNTLVKFKENIAAEETGVSWSAYQVKSINQVFEKEGIIRLDQESKWKRYTTNTEVYSHTSNQPYGYFFVNEASFLSDVEDGDILLIWGSQNEGVYSIKEVLSDEELIINTIWEYETTLPGDTTQSFAIFPEVQPATIFIGDNIPTGPGSTAPYRNKVTEMDIFVSIDQVITPEQTPFMPLSDTFLVTDHVKDPDWWENIIIPQRILPETSGSRRLSSPYAYANLINNPFEAINIGDTGFIIGTSEEKTYNVLIDEDPTHDFTTLTAGSSTILLHFFATDEYRHADVIEIYSANALLFQVRTGDPLSYLEYSDTNFEYFAFPEQPFYTGALLSGTRHNHAWNLINSVLKYGMFYVNWDLDSTQFDVNEGKVRDVISRGHPAHLLPYWRGDTFFTDVISYSEESISLVVGINLSVVPDSYTLVEQLLQIGDTWQTGDVYNFNASGFDTNVVIGMPDPNITFSSTEPEYGEYPLEHNGAP